MTQVPATDYTSRDYASIRQDLIDAISARLPNWTSRDPSDFGIVLIELFSYIGDLQSYYIDRVANECFLPTATQRSSLLKLAALIDYQPTGNTAALAEVQFTIQQGLAASVTVPQGTQVATQSVGGSPPVIFETVAPVTIYGAHMPTVTQTATGTGAAGQSIPLTQPYDGTSAAVSVSGYTGGSAGRNGTWTNKPQGTVLASPAPSATQFSVSIPAGQGIPTDGTASIVIVINSAPVTFYYTSATAATGTTTLTIDTTRSPAPTTAGVAAGQTAVFTLNSLNGVGAVNEFYIANNTVFFGAGGSNGNLLPVPPAGVVGNISLTYTSPPLYSGVVQAAQGQTVANELLHISDGTGNQQYVLMQSPVIVGSLQVSVDPGTGPVLWNYFVHLGDATILDRAYTTVTDENNVITVVFGDGQNGQIPPPGAAITATYRVGGGTIGNVGSNSITQLNNPITGVSAVTNPSPAVGGANAESNDHIRQTAPRSLMALNRAVTLDDYATLAIAGMGGGRASATAGVYTAVTLYINPPDGFIPDPTLLQARVTANGQLLTNNAGTGFLDTRKMANAQITIMPPFNADTSAIGYVPVDINVTVQAQPNFTQSAVQAAVTAAITNSAQTGLLDFPQVDFGMVVPISLFYSTLFRVSGVDYLQITKMNRHTTPSPGAPGDIICNASEIPQLGTLLITVNGGIPQ